MRDWIVAQRDAGMRLDAWLAARREIGSRSRARQALERGKVFVNDHEVVFSDASRPLRSGDRIRYWPDRPGSARPRARNVVAARPALRILHEDASLILVDKPPGVLVEPLPGAPHAEVTLADLLADHLRGRPGVRPLVVHRIDRDTSGLVLFALTPRARDDLKAQFERRTPERTYLAVVHGTVVPPSGTWRDTLVWDKERLLQTRAHVDEERARDAAAHYRVLEQHREAAVLEVSLVTGKRNQIRVQAALRGHPLVGERIYTGTGGRHGRRKTETEGPRFPRQALHAARLAFTHPATRRRVEFEAPIPDDLLALIEQLRRG